MKDGRHPRLALAGGGGVAALDVKMMGKHQRNAGILLASGTDAASMV